MNYKGYKDLDYYKQARLLRIDISEMAGKFPAAFDKPDISADELNTMEQKCESVFKLLNGHIAHLHKSKMEKRLPSKPNF